MSDISPEELRDLLRYEPLTGLLFWLVRPVSMFRDTTSRTAKHSCNNWNSRHAGKRAFSSVNGNGYFQGSIYDKKYQAHRVIWAMETGAWPVKQIDHEDHDGQNNRFGNLESVTQLANSRNMSKSLANTSGFTGVYRNKKLKGWRAMIMVDGVSIHLGGFKRKSDAIAARQAANIKYNFHANHGEGSRL